MAGLTDNTRGALLMIAAMSFFTVNDAFLKAVGDQMSVWQALFLRGLGVSLFMVVLLAMRGHRGGRGIDWRAISRRDWGLSAGRALSEAGAAFLFVTALQHVPLGNLAAIMQALPLTVTLAGMVFLRESLGWRRGVAIMVGLAGVLLIVRPGADGFSLYSLYAVGAVACVTARDLFARMLSPEAPSLVVATVSALGVTLISGAGVPFTGWSPVAPAAAGLLLGAMAAIFVGYVTSVGAMRVGDLGFVAPFRYFSLVVAILIGMAVFAEYPDSATLAGAAVVVASGGYTLWRERRAGQRARA